jgi:hypothetical protein
MTANFSGNSIKLFSESPGKEFATVTMAPGSEENVNMFGFTGFAATPESACR